MPLAASAPEGAAASPRRPGLALALALCGACARGGEGEREPPDLATVLARDRAAAWFAAGRWDEAADALAPLVAAGGAAAEDLVRAAGVELARGAWEAATPLARRALALRPDDPAAHWCAYRLALARGDGEGALAHLERVHALAPADVPAQLALATVAGALGHAASAERHFAALLGRAPARGARWLCAALAGHAQALESLGRPEEARRAREERERLLEAGIADPTREELDRGSFGRVEPARPGPVADAAALEALLGPPPEGRLEPLAPTTLEGVRGLVGLARAAPESAGEACAALPFAPEDVLAYGAEGVRLMRLVDGQLRSVETVLEQGTSLVVPVALRAREAGARADADADAELLAVTDAGLVLLEHTPAGWRRARERPLVADGFPVADLAPLDFDRDGDLDLLLVGAEGARLLRNDRTRAGGELVDASAEAGLSAAPALASCAVEDLDDDGDPDLLLAGAGGLLWFANAGHGRFTDATRALPPAARVSPSALVWDLVPDARPDLLIGGERGALLVAAARGRWSVRPLAGLAGVRAPAVHDLFHAGVELCLWPDPERGLMALAPLEAPAGPRALHGVDELAPASCALADLDGDGVRDVVESDGRNLRALLVRGAAGALRVSLRGGAQNPRGVGATLEVRAGPLYRRVHAGGEPIEIGLGRARRVDVLRVTWPDGRVQTELDLAAPGRYVVRQPGERSGS